LLLYNTANYNVYLTETKTYIDGLGLSLWLIGTVRAEPETVISRAWVQTVNPQTPQNKLFQDYWRACFEINFWTGKRV